MISRLIITVAIALFFTPAALVSAAEHPEHPEHPQKGKAGKKQVAKETRDWEQAQAILARFLSPNEA